MQSMMKNALYPDDEELKSLIRASKFGDVAGVIEFLDKGFDVNFDVGSSETALIIASAFGENEVVDLLISRGADVNLANDEECTPLHLAAMRGEAETCKRLANAGAQLNAVDDYGRSPLHYAAQSDDRADTARVLVAYGANAYLQDNEGDTPLMLASGRATEDVIKSELQARELKSTMGHASAAWSPSSADAEALMPTPAAHSEHDTHIQQRSRRL